MQDLPEDQWLSFGPFALDRLRKQLRRNDRLVELGSRAFELLVLLVERAPALVSREELTARAWPRTVVEETSLRVHMSALRRALEDGHEGARYIVNSPGRGYSFVADVVARLPGESSGDGSALSSTIEGNLPVRLSLVIGRDDIVAAVGRSLDRHRLVSIVGAGGMGKTTVALAVAEARQPKYEHGTWFVDLAPLSDGTRVPLALASVLGIPLAVDQPLLSLQSYLANKHVLIVLDNCEHVVDAAALLAESLLKAAPLAKVLATSREPLDAEGEWVHRVAPLLTPAPAELLGAEAAMAFPAIQLFVERASANSDSFVLTEQNLPAVRHLCVQLDGMPLAIELAAAHMDSLGAQGLATQLDDVFQLTLRGRRTAWARHQTLMAMLGWSYSLLGDSECRVLRRLSLFRSAFSVEAACSLVADDDISIADAVQAIATLARRSLICADLNRQPTRYRLLYTTRSYAAQMLEQCGEGPRFAQRHVHYLRDLLARAGVDLYDMPRVDWLALHESTIDDISAGLDWAFGEQGDDLAGVMLVTAALDLVNELGIWDEYRRRVELALERLRGLGEEHPDIEIMLCAAMCCLSGVTQQPLPDITGIVERTLALAARDASLSRQTEALYDVCVSSFGRGDYALCRSTALKVRELAGDPDSALAVLLGERFIALSDHYLGDQSSAQIHAVRVLNFSGVSADRRYHRQVPTQVSMNILRARIFWLEGRPDHALSTAFEAVAHAEADHSYALCQALAMAAIPIALWRGDDLAALAMCERLVASNLRCFHSYWTPWISAFRAVLSSRGFHLQTLHAANDPPMEASSSAVLEDLVGTLDSSMLSPGSVLRVDTAQVGWCAPEVLRVQAVVSLVAGSDRTKIPAMTQLERSISIAQTQGALAWELRSATSLARIVADEGRYEAAQRLLTGVLKRVTEGESTRDVAQARQLMDLIDAAASRSVRSGHGRR